MTKSPHQRHAELAQALREHDFRYYVLNQPKIPDREYDAMFAELVALERQHPELVGPASPTQRVSELLREGSPTVRHRAPMGSLDNTYNAEDLAEFDRRVREGLGVEGAVTYTCEPKIDGAGVEVVYENGVLVEASTRGDGLIGEDITTNVRTIRGLPLAIDDARTFSLRGEVVIYRDDLAKVNAVRTKEGEPAFANPRNAAAGSLRLIDPRLAAKRPLRVFFYDIVEPYFATQFDLLEGLARLGLPTTSIAQRCTGLDELLEFIRAFDVRRRRLPFETDGVAIKLDRIADRAELGRTARAPRWAIAYKYEAERAQTTVKAIEYDVGRTGAITPVAVLEPVLLAGTTVSHASLHNIDYVETKDVRIGDTVIIEKAGEIIPQVISVVTSARHSHARRWKPPVACPACGSTLRRGDDEVALRCVNPDCKGRLLAKLIYFASRNAMGIDAFGPALAKQLIESGLVKDAADIFLLTEQAHAVDALERMGEKSRDRLFRNIDAARRASDLGDLLTALGIPLVGRVSARAIARRFGTLEALLAASPAELEEALGTVRGIGPRMAASVAAYFANPAERRVVEKLFKLGVGLRAVDAQATVAGPLSGKSFCVTGTLSEPRDAIHALIRAAGGEVHERVTQATTYLVAGQGVGQTKIASAEKKGVQIISEADLRALAQGQPHP